MATQPDQFTADGLDVVYRGNPDFAYGRSATASAQPFSNLVIHHTANDHDLDWYVNYGQTVDAERGGAFGYHFYIGPNGEIVQGAPLSARTNHILPTAEGATARNNNSVGISIVGGEAGVTPAAQAAAAALGQALMQQYGIQPANVFNHGELQPGDRGAEAENAGLMSIVNTLRGSPAPPVPPAPIPVGPSGTPLAYTGGPDHPLMGAAGAAAAMGAGGAPDGGLPTLRNGAGSSSQPDPNVRALQEFLNENGQNLHVDGVFGAMTERAVRAYQQENGLEVDGVVGPETWGNIAGRAVSSNPAAADSLPGPVRSFVRRVFGDGAAGNLAARVDAFRNGIRKGLSPVDAFTQARGEPIRGQPVPGSAAAALPPKTAPVPPGNPARTPVTPATAAGVAPAPRPVVGDGLVNRPSPPVAAAGAVPKPVIPTGPADTAYDDIYGAPGPTAAQTAQYQAEKGMVTPPAPLADPAGMPQGRPQPTVPTTPAAPITGGDYLPAEWLRLKQLETNQTQFPTAAQPPGAVPALIPNQEPRPEPWRTMKTPLQQQGAQQPVVPPAPAPIPTQAQQLGIIDVRKAPPNDTWPMSPPTGPVPPFAEQTAAGMQSVAKGLNPAAIVGGMQPVSMPPPAGWGPPAAYDQATDDRMLAASIAKGINPDAVTAAIPPAPIQPGWSPPVDMTRQPPASEAMRLKTPPAQPVFTTTAPPALVPPTKAAAPAPAKTVAPKPIIPEDPKKKKAA